MPQEPSETDPATHRQIDRVVDALEVEAAGKVDHETLAAVGEEELHRYESSALVRDVVPESERDRRERLRQRYNRAPRRP